MLAHGAVQGGVAESQGGQFRHGFYAGFFTAGAASFVADGIAGAIESAIIGGTASVVGGGKFVNGAVSGAFQYLLNESQHKAAPKVKVELIEYALEGMAGTVGKSHAFLLVTDEATDFSFAIRAGPSKAYPGGAMAALTDKAYDGVTLFASPVENYIKGGSVEHNVVELNRRLVRSRTEILRTDENVYSIMRRGNNYAAQVNAAKIPYRPRSTNSNAYAFNAAEVLFSVSVPSRSSLPGSETKLKIGNK
jgi:hypothetical protein